MLPIFKNKEKSAAGLIIKQRTPDNPEEKQDDSSYELDCARDLINAVHAKDAKAVAKAIKDLANAADKEPHEEGEHVSPHSYDAQNQKAAQEE